MNEIDAEPESLEFSETEIEEDFPEKGLEAMLTGLDVDSHGNLVARFRNHGAVYFPDWEHWFVTKMLGRNRDKGKAAEKRDKKYLDIVRRIDENEKLRSAEKKKKDKYWWTYAVKCHIGFKDELPEEFVRGHYTQQARWRLCSPGNFITLDASVAYALKRERQIEKQLESLRARLSEHKKGNNLTTAVNDINQIFEDYTGENWAEIRTRINGKRSLSGLDEEILLARKELSDQIRISNQRLEGKCKIVYSRRNKSSREYTLRTEQTIDKDNPDWKEKEKPWAYIHRTKRTPSAAELMSKKWMFLDIEIPYFRREKPEITWIGVTYIEKGRERKVIHTTHNLGTSNVNGFEIVSHRNESELIEFLTKEVKRENPDFVSAYNARFDLVKLRESEAGFPIGDEDTSPLFKVTTKFFERIGVKDRIVLDPLRWTKIARAYDINAKLEMAAGFEKEISYDDMEKLEEESLSGKKEAGRAIAEYLSRDVAHLRDLVFSKDFENSLEDALRISKMFNLGIERLLHSANCINDVQEKGYFSALGIYREEVPPHLRTREMQQKRNSAREAFKKYSVEKTLEELVKGRSGLFNDVFKVYVPYGDFLRPAVQVRFPNAKKLYEYEDEIKKTGDSKRLFFLEQFSKEFGRWMIEDYGFFIKELRKFDKIAGKTNMEEFEAAYKKFKDHLSRDSEWGVKHFDAGTLGSQAIEKHATSELRDFLQRSRMSFEEFAELSNQRISVKRRWKNIIGNYGVAPSLRFADDERTYEWAVIIEEAVARKIDELKCFLEKEKFEVVGQEGCYLYLRGRKKALLAEDSPVVLVDEIPKVFVTDNVYYKKFGFYSHMKLKEQPDFHMTLFEMNAFREMLDCVMVGNNSGAVGVYERELERLKSGKPSNLELVFYNKNKLRYCAFTEESERKDGRKYFMIKAPAEGVKEDAAGKYLEDKERNETIRVDIMGIDSIKPDYRKYADRFRERAEAILKPIMMKGQMEMNLE